MKSVGLLLAYTRTLNVYQHIMKDKSLDLDQEKDKTVLTAKLSKKRPFKTKNNRLSNKLTKNEKKAYKKRFNYFKINLNC